MRTAVPLAAVVIASLGVTIGALADEPPHATASPSPLIVPTGTVSGSTTGKGKISAGAELRTGLGHAPDWDVSVAPTLTLSSSNGVANIISVDGNDSKGPSSWSVGLALSFIGHGSASAAEKTDEKAARRAGLAICVDRCAMPALAKDEQTFCDRQAVKTLSALLKWTSSKPTPQDDLESRAKAKAVLANEVRAATVEAIGKLYPGCSVDGGACSCPQRSGAEPLCSGAVKEVAEHLLAKRVSGCAGAGDEVCIWLARARFDRRRETLAPDEVVFKNSDLCVDGQKSIQRAMGEPASSPFPRYILSVGASYGANAFKYLDGAPGSTNPLTLANETKSDVTAGGVFTWVQHRAYGDTRVSVELPVIFQSKWSPSSNTAKWCSPKGILARTGGSDPVQSCDEQPLGGPQHKSQIWTALVVGGVYKSVFRVSIGPTFSYDFAATTPSPYAIGLQAPIYFSLLDGLTGYTGDYKGLVRLVPTFALVHKPDGLAPAGLVTVELLGKRSMFGGALDWP